MPPWKATFKVLTVAPTNFLFKLYSIHNKKTQLPLTPHEINKKKKNQDKMIKVPLHPKPEKFNSQGHVSYYTIQKKSKN
jgi:hypothetical protein